MKKHALCFALMSMATCGMLLLTSCEGADPVDLASPVETRSSAPSVPAILEVPEGHVVSFHTYAQGTQIYESMETAPGVYNWVFIAPAATLYANPDFSGNVGTHYGGPTWESTSGSWVKAAKLQGVTVDATAVPWLLLATTSSDGPGILYQTTHIQRVNTTGGLAPVEPANAGNVGLRIGVPYTAEYYFYRAQ